MAIVTLNIGIEGDKQVNATLLSMKRRVEDWSPFWAQVRNLLIDRMKQQFDTEGSRASAWQPLSARYKSWKDQHYPNKTILRLTDRLYNSLTKIDDPNMVYETNPQQMTFGTKVRYAAKHQLGEGRIPQRRILSLTTQDRRDIIELGRTWIAGNQ